MFHTFVILYTPIQNSPTSYIKEKVIAVRLSCVKYYVRFLVNTCYGVVGIFQK